DRTSRFRHRRAGARSDRRAPGRARLCADRRNACGRRRSPLRPGARARGREGRRRRGDAMRVAAALTFRELVRAPGRTLLRVLTLAASVGLLAAMLLFVGHSLGAMTGSAVRSVPLDWQGPVGSYEAATRV